MRILPNDKELFRSVTNYRACSASLALIDQSNVPIASVIPVAGDQVQFHPMDSADPATPDITRFPPGLKRLYEIYRDYIKHEDDLINHRSTWHLLIQGFLFATLAGCGKSDLAGQRPTPLAGKLLILRCGVGVFACIS